VDHDSPKSRYQPRIDSIRVCPMSSSPSSAATQLETSVLNAVDEFYD